MTADPPLTPRELHILVLLTEGQTHDDVAFRMGITPNTVKAHLQNVYHKLGTGSLVATYKRLGWLRVGPVRVKNPARPRPARIERDDHGRFAQVSA